MAKNILITDDAAFMRMMIKDILTKNGYNVAGEAENGLKAVEKYNETKPDLVLMDITMPEMDGITAMSKIREGSNVPVILLTAKSEDQDKILGLTVGADDYITKPFNPLEVTARVKSQLRRYLKFGSGVIKQDTYVIGGIELDDMKKEVTLDGEKISLTPKEYEILKLFMMNPDRVFSPKEIYETVWKEKQIGTDNTVAVHIRHLREKIEIDPANPRYIKVIFGQGYKIDKVRGM